MARLGHGSREVRNWKMTPRRDAAGVWATGKPGSWPIGDLPHARLALVYAMSPSHANVRKRVLRSVAREYPDYDWAAYWDREVRQGRSSRKTKGRKGLKSWDQTLGAPARSRRRVAANPKRRRNAKYDWSPERGARKKGRRSDMRRSAQRRLYLVHAGYTVRNGRYVEIPLIKVMAESPRKAAVNAQRRLRAETGQKISLFLAQEDADGSRVYEMHAPGLTGAASIGVRSNPRRRNSKSRWGSKTAPPLSSGVAWYPGHGPQAKGTDFRSWTNKKLLADGSAPARKELERRGRNPKTGKRRAWRNPRRRR